jgi:predicted unusual protein kinase regulating ubiquinone biosynthesis (AarF/ABC1/UbiB family)
LRQLFFAYVEQITVHGAYRADPHRGNILLTPDGRLALLSANRLGAALIIVALLLLRR